MPKADREYVLVQSELFKEPDDVDGMFDRKYQHVVFNGAVFRYDPCTARQEAIFWMPNRVSGSGLFRECRTEQRVGGPSDC